MKRAKKIIVLLIALVLVIVILFNNKNISVTNVLVENKDIPRNFSNFVICQLSDLHNTEFGKNNEELIRKLEEIKPNIILITGDLVDSRRYNLDIAINLIDKIKDIAPIYYVSGNHEAYTVDYETIKEELIKRDVVVLDNDYQIINIDSESIAIMGLLDPAFYDFKYTNDLEKTLDEINQKIDKDINFKILLSHRPELFKSYVKSNIDLVFSGHAHGGLVRLPLIGGLIAPNQGLFPKYDNGLYKDSNTAMYVSRGLGNSIIPLRINNNPEVVKLTLVSK